MRARPPDALRGAPVLAAAVWCVLALCPPPARAQLTYTALHVRTTLGGAAMVSEDQTGRLGFDSIGFIGQLHVNYQFMPWLDLMAGLSGGGFPAGAGTGGLLAPVVGLMVHTGANALMPFFQLDIGPGFTGPLARPFYMLGVGLELPVGQALGLGPTLGYGQLFQVNHPQASTDARFLWFGLSVAWRPYRREPPKQHTRWVTRYRDVVRESAQPPALDPAPEVARPAVSAEPLAPLNPELLVLLEQAVPSPRQELLAPVLFELDSAELEPIGVAMLHRVAAELARRPDIELLEVEGYADARGSVEHNLALSERRAACVLEWLVEHGIARERLRLAPHGAIDFVEPGSEEHEHAQNRRVVFRVIQERSP